jgi:hypothetical protein
MLRADLNAADKNPAKNAWWQSAGTGAHAGAEIGSSVAPGWGTAIGAIGGGITGLVQGAHTGRLARKRAKRNISKNEARFSQLENQYNTSNLAFSKAQQDNAAYNTFLESRNQRLFDIPSQYERFV